MTELTDRQQEILDYIRLHLRQHGRTPTFREIADKFGMKSPNSTMNHIKALERKGFIHRESGLSRGIELIGRDGLCPCCLQSLPSQTERTKDARAQS